MTFDEIKEIALSFPGVEEHLVHGGPTLRVRKRFLACIAKIDQDALVLKMPDQLEREFFLKTRPETFYTADHYESFDSILIRMSMIEHDEMRELFEKAWRRYAPKRLVASYQPNG